MITVQLDNEKYFTGSYAKVGSIPNGVKVHELPNDLSNHKVTCWKWETFEQTKEEQVIVFDEETGEPRFDENGNIMYRTEIITESVTDWVFDEEKHERILAEIAAIVPEMSTEEKIQELEAKNAVLEETLDTLLTDILPNLLGIEL